MKPLQRRPSTAIELAPQRPEVEPSGETPTQHETPQELPTKVAPVEENGKGVTVEPNEEASRTTEPVTETAPGGGEAEPGGIPTLAEAPKAEETRRPVEQLSDSDRQQIIDRVRNGLTVAINKFRPVYDALGVPIEEDSNYHAAIVPTENGSVTRFNAATLADNLYQDWLDGGTHYADQRAIDDTLEHELIHAAWISA